MTALVATVFLASLLGSLHCAGMCGAFMLFAVSAGRDDAPSPLLLHSAYHAGRLAVYTTLGAIAGAAGATLDLAGDLVGLQRIAAIAAGAMIAGFGLVTLLRLRGVRVPRPPVPAFMQALAMRGHRAAAAQPPGLRALSTGLLTTLLPCGWLYAFVITAAGAGSLATGALVMGVFWLGTLPVLIALGASVKTALGPLARRAPAIAALALVAVGTWTLLTRASLIQRTQDIFASIEANAGLSHDELCGGERQP